MGKRSDESLYALPDQSKGELAALLAEAHSLRDAESRLKEVKKRIVELVQEQGLGADGKLGARSGEFCTVIRWQDGRASLDRALLVEAGVTAAQLAAGTKVGQGNWVCELPRIGG